MDRVSLVLTVLIVAVIAYFAISKVDRPTGVAADSAVGDGSTADRTGTSTR